DTPVKHYSSGMYVRLAFAVAAHLEPEILLVDEVLAVGDINFQKKCLGKMGDVARQGRTVVLVTHQLNQIRRLCHRVLWIDAGSIRQNGPTHEVTSAYESAMARGQVNGSQSHRRNSKAYFVKWEIAHPRCDDLHTLRHADAVTVDFTVEAAQPVKGARHGIALYSSEQQLVLSSGPKALDLEVGLHRLSHTFPMLP